MITDVRRKMNGLMGLDMNYLSAERVLSQYGELMSASKAKLRGNPSSLSKFFPIWQQPHVAACLSGPLHRGSMHGTTVN